MEFLFFRQFELHDKNEIWWKIWKKYFEYGQYGKNILLNFVVWLKECSFIRDKTSGIWRKKYSESKNLKLFLFFPQTHIHTHKHKHTHRHIHTHRYIHTHIHTYNSPPSNSRVLYTFCVKTYLYYVLLFSIQN